VANAALSHVLLKRPSATRDSASAEEDGQG
jgi:hypothetical protein